MGLLTIGKALDAAATTAISGYIREHGVTQFLNTYNRVKNIAGDELRFGDEIECGVFVVDNIKKTVKLSVRSRELLETLEELEMRMSHQSEGCTWHPEFGNWMIESTPSKPYNNYASDLLRVERNMILRRRRLLSVLREDEIAPYVTCFPLMGVGDFIHEPTSFEAPYSLSEYVPDNIVNPHPRFAALTRNIRTRRTEKVDIRVPLFRDIKTPEFVGIHDYDQYIHSNGISSNKRKYDNSVVANSLTSSSPSVSSDVAVVEYPKVALERDTDIHMDAMAFGMGMCCLQVTFQARDIDESRYIYDQLSVLAPIMLAMTAATPFFKGRVSDVDVRWGSIAASVDDRTPAERGLVPDAELSASVDPLKAGGGVKLLPKSRYDSVSTYIYHCKGDPVCRRTFAKYNDVLCPIDEDIKKRLLSENIDENLAHHLAHLFTRDSLVVFEEKIELDDTETTEHFENIQSTNWQTCRWKPPPPRKGPEDPHIGWRTEFRSMEVQMTDFENAAFTVFVVLVTRVVLAFDLALYLPLSKVDENMRRAHQRDANVLNKFYFRKHMAPPPPPVSPGGRSGSIGSDTLPTTEESVESIEDNYEEMTMDEIFNGKDCYFPGLIPLVHAYLDYINTDPETRKRLNEYLHFISRRAKGESTTAATWMRNFVSNHPAYTHDSIISPEVAHDLLMACKQVGEGVLPCPDILGDIVIDRVRPQDAAGQVLEGRLNSEERRKLMKRLVKRAKKTKPDHIARGTFRSLEVDSDSDGEMSAETIRSSDHISQVLLNECEPCEEKRRKLPSSNICEG